MCARPDASARPGTAVIFSEDTMRILAAILASFLFSVPAGAATAEDDVAQYVQIFNGDRGLHIRAAQDLAWKGISDPLVFDIIERRLLADSQGAAGSSADKDRLGHYLRALGFSGQPKYADTIRQFLQSSSLKRFADAALRDLRQYERWNPVISNRAAFDPRFSDDVNRIMNMLRADDILLKEIGAKRIYFASKDEVLLDLLASELQANYMKSDRLTSDAIAWMAKGLGSGRRERDRLLLQEIAGKSRDSHIVRHANKALER
jgi:hypothetical protein